MSPFGSVGAMDGADAAYRDVLAAVPKGLIHGGVATTTESQTRARRHQPNATVRNL